MSWNEEKWVPAGSIELKPSPICVNGGIGVFAKAALEENVRVTEYVGDITGILPPERTRDGELRRTHLMKIERQDRFIDAFPIRSQLITEYYETGETRKLGAFINSATDVADESSNVRRVWEGDRLFFVTTRPIKEDEEIYYYYGGSRCEKRKRDFVVSPPTNKPPPPFSSQQKIEPSRRIVPSRIEN